MGSLDSKEPNFKSGNLWILNLWVYETHNQPKAHPNPQTESTAHTFEIAI